MNQTLKMMRGCKSIQEVAEACNITAKSLQAYEEGIRTPRDEVKLRLAEYYNKSVDSLC